jgi:NADH-quinone oxidoreductase subunit L
MLNLLWLIPALPFVGFLALVLAGSRLSRRGVAIIGVGTVGLSALVTALIGISFVTSPPPEHTYGEVLWTWMQVGDLTLNIALHLDALALAMAGVVTGVGFLIHLYSAGFMRKDEGYSRFFAYMNLFVGAMLTLVLADNLLLLYLGWEGVGLCSYLLIGFWYKDPANGRAARKAFIVTRIGDAAMAVGLFLLFVNLGTLQIQDVMQRAALQWPVGSGMAVAAAALLLGGALGKSAQVPLQIWLPDAMAGPSPVSALIHAATMVTAGVYLIARTHVLFELAPVVQTAVAVIGAVTLVLAGCSALTQHDLKRVLAYSTISQIGYMFLALGVGAWSAAIFHLVTHAFFKALLFLGAGVIILRLDEEHDMFKMGGLRKELPLVFWTFLIGSCSLAALPLVTAGFYSKDLILYDAWASAAGNPWLWSAGLAGALLTSLYTFRVVFVTFFGPAKEAVTRASPIPGAGVTMGIPLVALAALSILGGFVELPPILGNRPRFSNFLLSILPEVHVVRGSMSTAWGLMVSATVASLAGIWLAYLLFQRDLQRTLGWVRTPLGTALQRFWLAGWGFDWLADQVFIRPFVWLANLDKDDAIDRLYQGMAWLGKACHRALSRTQTGQIRWYAVGIVVGAAVVVGMAVFL